MSFREHSCETFHSRLFCVSATAALPIPAQVSERIPSPISFKRETAKPRSPKIRAGADVNEAQPDGTRPIHWAVYRVDYELLDALHRKESESGRHQ